jgi:hypothetical protein
MEDQDEVYDVIENNLLYGIHNQWNLHSFESLSVFFPQKCGQCNDMIFPLLNKGGIACLCCKLICHRQCMRKKNVICKFRKKTLVQNDVQTSDSDIDKPIIIATTLSTPIKSIPLSGSKYSNKLKINNHVFIYY